MTHDYERNGTTSLFAALEMATGKVHGRCFDRHTHEEFVTFLNSIVATGLEGYHFQRNHRSPGPIPIPR